jgi:plasmid maintenance system antidote protein VapI
VNSDMLKDIAKKLHYTLAEVSELVKDENSIVAKMYVQMMESKNPKEKEAF